MIRLFGWVLAGAILLGSASLAVAQDLQPVVSPAAAVGNGYPGVGGYGGLPAGNPGYPMPVNGVGYGPIFPGSVVPVVGSHKECYTLYPLTTTYPYTYTGPGSGFGNYSFVPYPYIPVAYGWYGEHWRGW